MPLSLTVTVGKTGSQIQSFAYWLACGQILKLVSVW